LKAETAQTPNFFEIQKAYKEYFDQVKTERKSGWKQFKRWENFSKPRVNPDGTFPDMKTVAEAFNSVYKLKPKGSITEPLYPWTAIGPDIVPEGINGVRSQGIGRVNVVRFHPTDQNIIWAGSASGGVWKTTNKGQTWSVYPFTEYLSLGVSDIAIAPSNPNVIYVATGDVEPAAHQPFYTIGLIKTTDGGATWNITKLSYTQNQQIRIGRVLVHPEDPNIVIVGGSNGVFKSTDGGESWSTWLTNLFIRDLKFKPNDYNTIYASTFSWYGTNYIYRTNDLCSTWKQVKSVSGTVRIALAVTPANPDIIYAVCASNNNRSFKSFIYSSDAGETWEELSNTSSTGNILGRDYGTGSDETVGQGEYDLAIAASPLDESNVYVGGINIWESIDYGLSFSLNTHWEGSYGKPFVHADIHDLAYQPGSNLLYAGCDGGIYVRSASGATWTDITKTMSITQFYKLSISQDGSRIIAGSQDNGTSLFKNNKWYHVLAGDGMACQIDPINPDRMYGSLYYGAFHKSTNGGSSFSSMLSNYTTGESGDWVAPLVLNPLKPSTLYAGYENVWRSQNYGSTWAKISSFGVSGVELKSIAVSAKDTNYIYAATSNKLYRSSNGGTSWDMIYQASYSITYIAIDENNPQRVWVSLSGFSAGNKVMEYDGTTWTNISGNLPNVPVNCIIYQNDSPDRLFVGTDVGVYYTEYNSLVWETYGDGLPNLSISELSIVYPIKKIYAATYGRGIWSAPLIECNLPEVEVTLSGSTTFCKGDSLILTAPSGYNTYNWSNGEKTSSITVKESGSYSVTVRNTSNCTASSSAIKVTVKASPIINVGSIGKACICDNDSVVLNITGTTSNVVFLWSTGETTRRITVREPGDYYATSTNTDNCSSTSNVFTVIRSTNPEKPTITQNGNTLISSESSFYQWYINDTLINYATKQTYAATRDGFYTVRVRDSCECTNISEPYAFIFNDVSDETVGSKHLNIIPNPNEGTFIVDMDLPVASTYNLRITDMLGRIVYELENQQFSAVNGNVKVNLNGEPKCLYVVRVSVTNGEYYIGKFNIE